MAGRALTTVYTCEAALVWRTLWRPTERLLGFLVHESAQLPGMGVGSLGQLGRARGWRMAFSQDRDPHTGPRRPLSRHSGASLAGDTAHLAHLSSQAGVPTRWSAPWQLWQPLPDCAFEQPALGWGPQDAVPTKGSMGNTHLGSTVREAQASPKGVGGAELSPGVIFWVILAQMTIEPICTMSSITHGGLQTSGAGKRVHQVLDGASMA